MEPYRVNQILKNHRARTSRQYQKMVGEKLRIYRLNKEKTQEEMAHLCLCNRGTIIKIEAGDTSVSAVYLFRYIVALNASSLLKPFEEIVQYPTVFKHKIEFSKRVKTKKRVKKKKQTKRTNKEKGISILLRLSLIKT